LRDIASIPARTRLSCRIAWEMCRAVTTLECNKEKLHCRLADIHHIAGGDAVFIFLFLVSLSRLNAPFMRSF
jgi:hypothetical protein